jgi:hypothetical protein
VHFDRLDARAALARLDQAGHRIERSRVELPAVSAAICCSPRRSRCRSRSRRCARGSRRVEPPPRQRERIAGARAARRAASSCSIWAARSGRSRAGRLPVAEHRGRGAAVLGAERRRAVAQHFSGVLYQLERPDGALRNAELDVPPIRRRYFKLAVAEKGGGLGGGAPALEVAWVPEQLVFVARGAGPFALGYGRAQRARARSTPAS